jgi:hypothetical protein
MIKNSIFGKVKILYDLLNGCLVVRPLDWTPEYIEQLGGEEEAWIVISKNQLRD